jgi:2-polyprenyl-6-methoxyphenol hydroxylase-like FAD-dependent oxidoreductase
VDEHGRRIGGFSTDAIRRLTNGRFTTLRRSDLSATIYAAIDGKIETILGDSIAMCEDTGERLHIRFDHAAPRDVDLLIGADGLHSRVRRLAFEPQEQFDVSLGYHVAAFEVAGYRPRDELVFVTHGLPGRQISRFAMRDDKTLFLFVFHDEYLNANEPANERERKAALKHAFADVGWECPQILNLLESTGDFYFDHVSQIRMQRWSNGRVALIGDAAACVSLLAGEGTGLAMAEAYVLAGELARAEGDYRAAFARYEARMMPFLQRKQQSAARFASSFAPRSALGLTVRNLATRLFQVPSIAHMFVSRSLRDDIALPDYRF